MKLKQQDVSSEVLVTAIDVKYNFTEKIDANQEKMLNTVTEPLEGDWKLNISKAIFSKPRRTTRVKIMGISKLKERMVGDYRHNSNFD